MAIPSVSSADSAVDARPERVDVSVLIPVLNEAETVQPLADRVLAVLDELGRSCEIIYVDAGYNIIGVG